MKALEELAMSQWNMFTTAQAQQLGMQRNQIARLRNAGRVEEVSYGVYQYVSGIEAGHADIKAAWLSVFPKETVFDRLEKTSYDAVISGRTAAYIHGLDDFRASPYTFSLAIRKQTSRADMRYLQQSIDARDIVVVDHLPVTTVERTVYDLIRLGEDPDLVGNMVTDAARSGHKFDKERLAQLLAPLAKRYGYDSGDGVAFVQDLFISRAVIPQLQWATASLVGVHGVISEVAILERFWKTQQESIHAITKPILDLMLNTERVARVSQELKKTLSSLPGYTIPNFSHQDHLLEKKINDD